MVQDGISINYRILAFGHAGSQIIAELIRQNFPDTRLSYFDTDKNAIATSTLNNKYQLGIERVKGKGTAGRVSTAREIFADDKDLFDRLTAADCLYFIVGGPSGGVFTGIAAAMAVFLFQKERSFVFITSFPFSHEPYERQANAAAALKEINQYTDKVILVNDSRASALLRDKGIPVAFHGLDTEAVDIIRVLLFDTVIADTSGKPDEKKKAIILRVKAYVREKEYLVLQQNSEIILANTNKALMETLLVKPEIVHSVSARKFEELVQYIYQLSGHETELTNTSRDHGIDLKVWTLPPMMGNKFLTIVQSKRYAPANKVGEPEVRDLIGALLIQKAERAQIVTSSDFSQPAIKAAKMEKIDLIRFYELADRIRNLIKDKPVIHD